MKLTVQLALVFFGVTVSSLYMEASPVDKSIYSGAFTFSPVSKFNIYQGIIRDRKNQPVAGAQVRIAGKDAQTQSDKKGSFTIQADEGDTLVVSRLGFSDLRMVLGSTTTISVMLED